MGDEEGVSRADPRVEYIAARVQATFPKMVVSQPFYMYSSRDRNLHFQKELPQRRVSWSVRYMQGARGAKALAKLP